MDKIAFIAGETFLYWNSILITLSTLTATILFLAFYLGRSGNGFGAFLVIPMSFLSSLVISRFIHWYCQTDNYASLLVAMTDYSAGGYALCGVFVGCILSACLLRILKIVKDLPQMLDAMALAGAAGIGLGRLACFYTSADRGDVLDPVWEFPVVWPVINPVTGAEENRLAIFFFQALVCGVIFLCMLIFWLTKRDIRKNGDTCLMFLLVYGVCQVLLDSLRYDSLYFRTNGFISIVQILCAAGILLAVIVFSVRLVKGIGFYAWQLMIWVLVAGFLGLAGYMEYYIQRHGNLGVLAYSIMGGSLLFILLFVALFIYPIGTRNAPGNE